MYKTGSVFSGVLLMGVGLFFLLVQFIPGFTSSLSFAYLWPLPLLLLAAAFWVGTLYFEPTLAIPATILSAVGSILFYQNSTGNWHHWQLWLLMPAIVGIGLFLGGYLGNYGLRKAFPAVVILQIIGWGLFFFFTIASYWQNLWPILLIGIGLYLLRQNLRQSWGKNPKNF
jgi:hypothetical protein